MAVDLRLNRVNADSAWGFRIVGGADFGEPLIVVKVNENSLAENAGMMVGDVIVRINDTPTAGLTHTEAHDLLIAQGNEFVLGVRRGSMPSHIFHEEIDEEFANISKHVEQSIEGNYEEQYSSMVKEAERTIDQDVLDEAIQRINEYNIQDTLEKRIQDQVERTQHTVSAEQIINSHQTRMEKMQPITHGIRTDKKWSTFLQKPDNPIPKSKKKIEEEEQEGEKYTVVIQKQPSRRKRKEMQEKRVQFSEDVTEMEIEKEEEIEEDDYSDTIEIQQSLDIEVNVDVQEEEIVEVEEGLVDYETEDEIDSQNFGKRDTSEEIEVTYPPLSEIKIEAAEGNTTTLEEQLLAVQKQLQALSMLPSAIQLTLDAVSKQLASIVSTKEEKEMNGDISKSSSERDEIELQEQLTEEELLEDRSSSEIAEAEPHKQNGNDDHSNLGDELDDDLEIGEEELREILERNATPVEEKEQDPFAGMTDEEKQEILREEQRIREEEERKMKEEELKAKKQKAKVEEPEEYVPPIILPGGIKWSDPDDVMPAFKKQMTDEEIEEAIASHLEVIAGKRKGINFKKYEPPPKSLEHLQYSEVYKMLQEEEPARPRGIAARPEKIPAVQDYYQASQEAP